MSAGQIAALIAAGAFVLLVVLLAIPLLKLGRTFDEATIAIRRTHENTDPLLLGANETITHVNTQLERVDAVTANARKLLELANTVDAVQDGRIHIEKINGPFLFKEGGSSAEYKAGLDLAIARGWLWLHESGTYVRFTEAGADLFA